LHSCGYAELAARRLYSGADDICLHAIIPWSQCGQHFRNPHQPNGNYEIGLIVGNLLKSLRRDQQGTTAVEFGIIAPVLIALLVGTMGLSVALYLIGSLHFAVEDGARCASVKAACQVNGVADAALTQAYTQSRYFGPHGVTPTFTYAAGTCGTNSNSVSASLTYSVNVLFKTLVIPISATACFP
jgi:Flp pilus assembly pilin Flp